MSDICELILDQHHEMRRAFAALDELSAARDPDQGWLLRAWTALRGLLDAHAEAEEMLFYPILLRTRGDSAAETTAAVTDHNRIRDACREAERKEPGSDSWWSAVRSARRENSTHMAEEERGALRGLRTAVEPPLREKAGARWEAFMTGRLSELAAASHDKDAHAYVAAHQGESR
jgi:hypothetical protein